MQTSQDVTNAVADNPPQAASELGCHGNEAANPVPGVRCPELSLQVPPTPLGLGKSRCGKNLLQSQDALKGSSSSRGLLRALSFKKKVTISSDGEKSSLLKSNLKTASESPPVLANFMSAWHRCNSLPVNLASKLSPSASTPVSERAIDGRLTSRKGSDQASVSRSLSVPGRNFGALRLVHEECAVKWFSTKGNKNCDVCGKEVLNLPVTLVRVPSSTQRINRQELNQQSLNSRTVSTWQDFVVLVLISTICYFFFLEQLMLHLNAVYTIMLSSALGLGIAMSLNSLCVLYVTWRVQVSQSSSPV